MSKINYKEFWIKKGKKRYEAIIDAQYGRIKELEKQNKVLVELVEAFQVYFETLNEGRHGYAQYKIRNEIKQALANIDRGEK